MSDYRKLKPPTSKPGRNAPCPCGSGKKYKQCCEGREITASNFLTKWIVVIVISLLALGLIGFVTQLARQDQNAATPRRVWSAEHNHWHDVP
jgi:hypothetical protein